MKPKLIRNLDDNLFNRARADALMKGENIGVWLEDAIIAKLEGQAQKKKSSS